MNEEENGNSSEDSFVDGESRDNGFSSSGDETDSEEQNSRRDPVIDEIEELATQ